MARLLMVGGGCRGLDLARDLRDEGHAVRAATRETSSAPGERTAALLDAGCEVVPGGDPNRIASLYRSLDNVTIVLWLLGSVRDAPQLHGSRLSFMLERTIDTTVRGFAYEATGPAGDDALAEGRRHVAHARDHHGIPVGFVEADPLGDRAAWKVAAHAAIDVLLRA